MEETAAAAAARLLSTEDVVVEILQRVSTDVAALFRCAVACKRWYGLVADRSFLRRCWPENAPTMLGFLVRQRVDMLDVRSPYRLFFVPPPAGSVLGSQRRLLTSMAGVDGVPDDDSRITVASATRRGLLLLSVPSEIGGRPKQMAVCDLLAGWCHVLPPLPPRRPGGSMVSSVSCTILKGAECGQHQLFLNYFKVLAVVLFYPGQECKLYTFSSTESRWSAPIKCFDEKICYRFPLNRPCNAVVCGETVHWLLISSFERHDDGSQKYYTLDVSTADTAHTSSLTKLPVGITSFDGDPTLDVTADGSLALFCVQKEAPNWRLHMWMHIECEVWLQTRVIELDIPREPTNFMGVHILPVEKSNTLFIVDEHASSVHKINFETGTVEVQQFQLSRLAVPMNIEWPTWLASRLS